MRLRSVDRTATIAWSPGKHSPLLATGTVAGAFDASFNSSTSLEIFDLNLDSVPGTEGASRLKKVGSISSNARFNRLAWGLSSDPSKTHGILVGGKENGELELWNPKLIIDNGPDALVLRQSAHSGPVRGLDFSSVETKLFASGSSDGEIFVWDLNNPAKPYSPGARSLKLEDITALSWNRQAGSILATASNNGQTAIWDLRTRKDLITLSHPGGRRAITSVAWHPEHATQIVTAADDDMSPVILTWDLRNARAPERQLAGHTKSILSLSWCPKDSDLLLSCGKDNRTLVWNMSYGEVIGDLEHSNNWAFDVQWCSRNPDLIGVASFDGKVSVHSLQGSSTAYEEPVSVVHNPGVPSDDPFAMLQQYSTHTNDTGFVLPYPPKWLRRPVGATWGFGGKLAVFNKNLGPTAVSVKSVATNVEFFSRAQELEGALQDATGESLLTFCKKITSEQPASKGGDVLGFLRVMLERGEREQVLEFLGFNRNNIAGDRLAGLLEKLKIQAHPPAQPSPKPTIKTLATKDDAEPTVGSTPFKLYPVIRRGEESDVDVLITRALILGDFETAVTVCLGADRLADAVMLAVCGGHELLERTQAEYFKRTRDKKSYARILHSVANQDLRDIVLNADLDGVEGGWRDILALIWTYANPEDFSELLNLIGERLEASAASLSSIKLAEKESKSLAAVLCYLGAGNLKRVLPIWTRSDADDIKKSSLAAPGRQASNGSIPLPKLQAFIEKISLFREAIQYQDGDLVEQPAQYELESLYNYYAEYAEHLSAQGNIFAAQRYLNLIPMAYASAKFIHSNVDAITVLRDRVYQSGGYRVATTSQPMFPFELVDVSLVSKPEPVAQQPAHNPYASYPHGTTASNAGYDSTNYGNTATYTSTTGYYNPYPGTGAHVYSPSGAVNLPPPPIAPINNGLARPGSAQGPLGYPSASASASHPAYDFGPSSVPQPNPPSISHHGPPAVSQPPPRVNTPLMAPPRSVPPTGVFSPIVPSAPAPVPEPAAPTRHPFGDLSHIPAEHKPLVASVQKYIKSAKDCVVGVSVSRGPSPRKIIEDAEKRVSHLLDQLNNSELPKDITDKLSELFKGLDSGDYASSHAAQVKLMSERFDVTGAWVVGIKRLIDSAEQAAKRAAQPSPAVSHLPPPPTGGIPSASAQGRGAYGAPPASANAYGAPPPSANPYGAPPPSANPYGAPPASANPYGTPPPAANYGAPPTAANYGAPPASNYGAPPPQGHSRPF
ncbi:uncharacterized protein BJ171DRAFT_419511 [Polychytrium aggregatum]|uniref:uncharacterized protein n=1 Tax=Polychytrium aggregatum TaxID=110093 RepID=UPI0022FEB907|nr:uncharacterized protein BJ171DRAFT_419511 [Polychytrium aggregatum]KAI9208496.1 hypothetical protein BJ171DRAFT_419511 [Polychytrium aggregatum]